MSRYIDADKVISAVCFGCNQQFSNEPCEPPDCSIRQAINSIPTADVVEVRHGEWETIPDYLRALTTYRHICSECKTTYKDIRPLGHNYCHFCGAKMDGERRE